MTNPFLRWGRQCSMHLYFFRSASPFLNRSTVRLCRRIGLSQIAAFDINASLNPSAKRRRRGLLSNCQWLSFTIDLYHGFPRMSKYSSSMVTSGGCVGSQLQYESIFVVPNLTRRPITLVRAFSPLRERKKRNPDEILL
jgi:hypothetical protein